MSLACIAFLKLESAALHGVFNVTSINNFKNKFEKYNQNMYFV